MIAFAVVLYQGAMLHTCFAIGKRQVVIAVEGINATSCMILQQYAHSEKWLSLYLYLALLTTLGVVLAAE
jgi:hypothetical protein